MVDIVEPSSAPMPSTLPHADGDEPRGVPGVSGEAMPAAVDADPRSVGVAAIGAGDPSVNPVAPDSSGADVDSDPNGVQSEPDPPTVSPDPSVDPGETEPGPNSPSLPDPEPDPIGDEVETETGPQIDGGLETPLSFAADIWPLWSADRDPVFVYRGMGSYTGCADETAPCHGAANPGALLSMVDIETAYAQMMDTESTSGICEGTQRVAVGDPDRSCLVLFYEGRLGPQDLDWVDDAEIELMREWIRQGALP